MNATKLLNTKAAAYGAVILVGGALLYWVAGKILDKAGEAAERTREALDPTSDQNLAYRSTNAVGASLSGDPSWSLGSWMYDLFNPSTDITARVPYTPRKLEVGEGSLYATRAARTTLQ